MLNPNPSFTWFYGRNTVQEILKSKLRPKKLIVAQGVQQREIAEILKLAELKRVPVQTVGKDMFRTIAPDANHQGVALQLDPIEPLEFKPFLEELKVTPKTFICLLDEVQDPQNLGAIIRSAACFGCSAVILPKWRSANLTPAVLKASSGAAACIPIVEISNLSVAIERLKEKGFFVVGADARARDAVGVSKFPFPLALLLGNEQRGIKPTLQKACDQLFVIPQTQAVASLNVSNAAAVFFYEISKQIA